MKFGPMYPSFVVVAVVGVSLATALGVANVDQRGSLDVATTTPEQSVVAQGGTKLVSPVVVIPVAMLRRSQVTPNAEGVHSSDFEAENGIRFRFSGKEGVNGGATQEGEFR